MHALGDKCSGNGSCRWSDLKTEVLYCVLASSAGRRGAGDAVAVVASLAGIDAALAGDMINRMCHSSVR